MKKAFKTLNQTDDKQNFYFYFYMVELQGAEKPIFAIIDTM